MEPLVRVLRKNRNLGTYLAAMNYLLLNVTVVFTCQLNLL